MEINLPKINISIPKGNFELNALKKLSSRYITPPKPKTIPERRLKYSNAVQLAKDIEIKKDERHFVFLDGSFIFGDYIEALIVENNFLVKHMIISTLSLSENNVDSLQNLIVGDYIEKLDLIVSHYFYAHEKGNLLPYIYKQLDIGIRFQFASADTHCKICIFETKCGKFVCIHGSANLRSSGNIEQFIIEESEDLYSFMFQFQKEIIEKYKTINHNITNIFQRKSPRGKELWKAVQKDGTTSTKTSRKKQRKPDKANRPKQSKEVQKENRRKLLEM